jgi:hypothetical protein
LEDIERMHAKKWHIKDAKKVEKVIANGLIC